MDISIIVPLYKGQKYIEKVLNMIRGNNRNAKFLTEVIFVNDFPSETIRLPDLSGKINCK